MGPGCGRRSKSRLDAFGVTADLLYLRKQYSKGARLLKQVVQTENPEGPGYFGAIGVHIYLWSLCYS